jgi:preprotein translocase subunit SecA
LQQGAESFLFDPEYVRGREPYLRPANRRDVYNADITYGTNNEFGFDYLRDNLAMDLDGRVQRELRYALVDEVDNVFIDQARTPLIISGPLSQTEQQRQADEHRRFADVVRRLELGLHYELDDREQNVTLTDVGLHKVEEETGITNIYDAANYYYVHFLEQALKAKALYLKGRDYIVQSRRVVLIDQFTGRLMPDRRLSEGLHQAIEAKEKVDIRHRMMTHATVTIQNYFRMYEKLAGMTGTAATDAEELFKIYECDTVVLPTNVEYRASWGDLITERIRENGVEVVTYHRPDDPDERFFRRIDYPDVIFRTEKAKWQAIIQEIEECSQDRRPILVGTASVEKSEELSRQLRSKNIKHQVLYAKEHDKEASIIAKAGRPGVVTVATQMAGRGVDIKLGGDLSDDTVAKARRLLESRGYDFFRVTRAQLYNAIAEIDPDYVRRREEVLQVGGLHIIGTERYEARRIDNQLRGRAGRQGEPGSSRFYLSLEDDLTRRFGGDQVKGLIERLGIEDDVPIEHGLISKTIESAQGRVEGHNFDIRKHLLEYDDVLTRQRELIYDQRYRILTSSDLRDDLWEMIETEMDDRLTDGGSDSRRRGDDAAEGMMRTRIEGFGPP